MEFVLMLTLGVLLLLIGIAVAVFVSREIGGLCALAGVVLIVVALVVTADADAATYKRTTIVTNGKAPVKERVRAQASADRTVTSPALRYDSGPTGIFQTQARANAWTRAYPSGYWLQQQINVNGFTFDGVDGTAASTETCKVRTFAGWSEYLSNGTGGSQSESDGRGWHSCSRTVLLSYGLPGITSEQTFRVELPSSQWRFFFPKNQYGGDGWTWKWETGPDGRVWKGTVWHRF